MTIVIFAFFNISVYSKCATYDQCHFDEVRLQWFNCPANDSIHPVNTKNDPMWNETHKNIIRTVCPHLIVDDGKRIYTYLVISKCTTTIRILKSIRSSRY